MLKTWSSLFVANDLEEKQINISNKLNYVKLTYKHYQINTDIPFISSFKNRTYKMQVRFMEAHLVKIMTIKLHCKSILIQLKQILWTCCVFLSSLNNTFFSMFFSIIGCISQVSAVGQTHSSQNIKNIMLKIRNYYIIMPS